MNLKTVTTVGFAYLIVGIALGGHLKDTPGPIADAAFKVYTDSSTGAPAPLSIYVPVDSLLDPGNHLEDMHDISYYLNPVRWSLTNGTRSIQPLRIQQIGTEKAIRIYPPSGSVAKGDKLTLTVMTTLNGKAQSYTKDLDAAPDIPNFAQFQIDPSIQKAEKLVDKSTQTVGQAKLTYKQYFSPGNGFYATSASVFSSSDLDPAATLDFHIGNQWSIGGPHLVPFYYEVGTTGNQKWSNAEAVATVGINPFVLPFGWSFSKRTIQPDPGAAAGTKPTTISSGVPCLDLGLQFANWYKQDSAFTAAHPDNNSLRVKAHLSATPIYLFEYSGNNTAFFNADLTGWYFPTEHATGGASVHSFEGLVDLSLCFPYNKSNALSVHWITGAQEASNFARTSSLGIEFTVVK